MTFVTSLTVLPIPSSSIPSGAAVTIDGTTWHLDTTLDGETALDRQSPVESVRFVTSPTGGLLTSGPIVYNQDLSIFQQTNGDFVALSFALPGDQGMLYRSGVLTQLPPSGATMSGVGVVGGSATITTPMITTAVARALPFTMPGLPPGFSGVVTTASIGLGTGVVGVTLFGSITPPAPSFLPAPPGVTFAYTGLLTFRPSISLFHPEWLVVGEAVGTPSIVFNGTAFPADLVAIILTLIGDFIAAQMTPLIVSLAEQLIDSTVRSAVAGLLPTGTTLPNATTSVQNIVILPTGIRIDGARGAFAPIRIVSTFPPPTPQRAPLPKRTDLQRAGADPMFSRR